LHAHGRIITVRIGDIAALQWRLFGWCPWSSAPICLFAAFVDPYEYQHHLVHDDGQACLQLISPEWTGRIEVPWNTKNCGLSLCSSTLPSPTTPETADKAEVTLVDVQI
jgi:hypothetical protein